MDKAPGCFAVVGFVNGEVHVQIAVVVIVEKGGHGRLYVDVEAIFGGHVFKMRYAVFIDALVYI